MSVLAYGLVWAGAVVTAVAAIRLLLMRNVWARLHFVGPATALAAPLVIVGLAVAPGIWTSFHDVLKLALIGVLIFGTGPAAVAATARAAARREAGDG